ncbi:TonB-dependent receptor [Asticcacaulis sp. 201]|uniref:TonB-dependent receptor n=1 Tax=Asticcacaulis sp. 201 TaxID=3028787 RepID=UPI0029166CBE|nr:TonB-dependent receptor [Asticcacaulis sp. 201]MDV6330636.1 TonB-dependent receptor [Asticcacaulis sp. 201]
MTTAVAVSSAGWVSAQETGPSSAQATGDDTQTQVVVTGRKKAVTRKIDKTVYNTADNPKSENGTAQDVLQSTPTVSVSAEGSIAVKGNPNVTVLINGKPSAVMSGETRAVALQTLSGSDIASVEVITNPSAAYAANGGAIINIVLKKNRKAGAHGSVRASATDQGLWNVNLSGDYTKNKLSLHASLGVRRDGNLKFRQSDVNWRDPLTGKAGENQQSSKVFVRRWVQNASLGLDYDLSETDSVSASGTYNFRRSRPYFDEFHQDYEGGALTDAYHRISKGPNQQSDSSLTLGYNHQDDDTIVKAAIQHSDTVNLVDKSFRNLFVYPQTPPGYERILNKAGHNLDQATFDYARPVTGIGQVTVGIEYRRDANRIGNYFASVDPLTDAETVDFNATHRYQVVDTQKAAYVTAQVTWASRWEALIGARFEAVTTRLEGEHRTAIRGASYQSLNPSLHLKYSLDGDKSLSLSYRQSLQRPDPRDLSPYTTYWDAQNLFVGNPDLKPQPVKSLELTYESSREDLSRSFGVFYRRSTDTVVDVRTFTADNILLNSKQNAGKGLSTGLTGSVDWRLPKGFHISTDASVYYLELDTIDLTVPVHQSGLSYYANLAMDYSSGANDFAFDAHVTGPSLTPQGTESATNTINATWKRRLTPRLTFTLSASDILDGSKQSYSTDTSTFTQRGYNHFVARRVYVGLVYKIG